MESFSEFVTKHESDDIAGLLLSGKFPDNIDPGLAANTIERLMAVPFVAMLFCLVFGLKDAAMGALMIFAMLPTAQSCYVMTASMRGNAPIVAEVTTAHTLAAMVTLPVLPCPGTP